MKKLINVLVFISLITSCSKKTDPAPVPIPVILPDTLSMGWTKINSLPNEFFTDIFFTDSAKGYATSSKGIYKTVNAAVSWTKINTVLNSVNISAANSNRVCFVNNASIPFVTQDGGTTFQTTSYIAPGGGVGFADCFFSSTNSCYLSSVKFIWKSTDGGSSFDTVYNFQNLSNFSSLFFLDDQTGWIIRSEGLYKTIDGGNSWNLLLPKSNGYGAMDFVSSTIGYSSLSDDTVPVVTISKTSDGGVSWQIVFQAPNQAEYVDIDFVNTTEGYICSGNRIYKTVNGGNTWLPVVALGNARILEIHFTDANHGWACTTDGTVVKLAQ